ncbi:LicD family protein [Stutzerimonas stutzeri]|uniref:LicD family protein n=1 Tax=Stutzerimonas stutzeri TaxID=316 RepID=UPI0022DD14C2|nr:LicD family protein [Stutzerimonas stutzeri]WBL59221.1 LicD family protein [Stutzerimonas stutzeri]
MTLNIRDLTPDELDEYKNKLRHNLKLFHDFCESHGLTYYLSDGTLLGAIRHQGMIPWDDDIDVCMPRQDYAKLEFLSHLIPSSLMLTSITQTPDYIFPYLKISNVPQQYCEIVGGRTYVTGAWIDVFPLDGTYQNKTLRKLHYLLAKTIRSAFNIKTRGKNTILGKNTSTLKKMLFFPSHTILKAIPLRLLFKLMDGIAQHKSFDKAHVVGNLYTSIGIRASHDKKIFSEKVKCLFDGMQLYAPSGHHQYLKNLYGDYLTPPPASARQQHNIKIFNLPN